MQACGGGVCGDYGADITVKDSILRSNTAPSGNQLESNTTASTLSLSYCDVEGLQGSIYVMSGATLSWGSGNIGLDPLFANGPLGNYYLARIAEAKPQTVRV